MEGGLFCPRSRAQQHSPACPLSSKLRRTTLCALRVALPRFRHKISAHCVPCSKNRRDCKDRDELIVLIIRVSPRVAPPRAWMFDEVKFRDNAFPYDLAPQPLNEKDML